jgi:hypothetical protein
MGFSFESFGTFKLLFFFFLEKEPSRKQKFKDRELGEEQCVACQIASSCVDLGPSWYVCQDQSCPNSERMVY